MAQKVFEVKNFLTNESSGKVNIDTEILLKLQLDELLLNQYLTVMKAAYHSVRTACTKPRSLVAGSRAKKQKQKGTGNARLSDKLAPHFRGGGTIFGPVGQIRSVSVMKKKTKMIKKMLLAHAIRENKLIVVSDLDKVELKTKTVNTALYQLCQLDKKDYPACVIVGDGLVPENLLLATANLPGVVCTTSLSLTVHHIVSSSHILITADALEKLIKSLI